MNALIRDTFMRGSRNISQGGGGGSLLFLGSRGGPTFSRGGATFSRGGGEGPTANFYRNPYDL